MRRHFLRFKKKKNNKKQFFPTLTGNVEVIPIDLGLFSRTEQVSLHQSLHDFVVF